MQQVRQHPGIMYIRCCHRHHANPLRLAGTPIWRLHAEEPLALFLNRIEVGAVMKERSQTLNTRYPGRFTQSAGARASLGGLAISPGEKVALIRFGEYFSLRL